MSPGEDVRWMRRALALAARGLGETNPNPVVGGNNTIATVTLSSPALSGCALVTPSCSNTAVNTCPPSVTVPAGQTSGTISDGCGGTVNCGTCPTGCSSLGFNCGTTSDGCGGTLSCDTCSRRKRRVSNVCQ